MVIANVIYASGEHIAITQHGRLVLENRTQPAWDGPYSRQAHTDHKRVAEKIITHLQKLREVTT